MEKIAYNEDGPILYVQGNEASVLATTEPYTYVTDLPAGMTQYDIDSFHAEAGVIVPGPWVDPSFVETPSLVSVSYQHSDPASYVANVPATHDGTITLATQTANMVACSTDPSEAASVSINVDVQLWNNAMSTPFLVLLNVVRSFEADVVTKDGFLYLCTKDHTSSLDIVPGEASGLSYWCPCGPEDANPLAPEWEELFVYNAGSQQLLGSAPSYIANLSQMPPQSFQTISFSIKDSTLPSFDLGITELYYRVRAFMLSETGGGTNLSNMISLYGIDLMRATQTITLTRNT